MKNLLEYILEAKSVGEQIHILADYIYQRIKDLVDADPETEGYDNLLDEYIADYGKEAYPIEINFSDVKGFDPKRYDLLTYHMMGEDYEDIDCDMLVGICTCDGMGAMDTDEPLLMINKNTVRKRKKFYRNTTELMNTIAHELTHYVQHLSYASSGGHTLKDAGGAVAAELVDNTKGNMKYYIINFILYAINPIELDARKQGFYQTMKYEINKKLEQYKKKFKVKDIDIDEFCDFVINHKDYDKNTLHMGYFNLILDAFKDDKWEDYKKCLDDPDNKYRDDSIIYVLLNICDARDTVPHLPMPSKHNFVMNINSEQRFNQYKEKLVKHYSKNINNYSKKLKNVIKLVYEEINK